MDHKREQAPILFENIKMPRVEIEIKGQKYHIKIAHTIEHRRKGLQGVAELKGNEGMLLLWGETRFPDDLSELSRPFVSMCVPMDLSVVFLDEQAKPVEIMNNLSGEPNNDFASATRYFCSHFAAMMLELPGNVVLSEEDVTKVQEELLELINNYHPEIS